MADTRQKFQGKCFQSTEGHQWMRGHYDEMPPEIRKRLMDSPFNLCAACVNELAMKHYCNKYVSGMNYYDTHELAINEIEAAIRAELGPFGPQPVNPAPLAAKLRMQK